MRQIDVFCAKDGCEQGYLGSSASLVVIESLMAQHIASYGSHAKDGFAWNWGKELTQTEKWQQDLDQLPNI